MSSGSLYWYTEATQQKRTVKTVYRMGGSLAYGYYGQLFDIAIIEVDTPYSLNSNVVVANLPTARTPLGTNLIVSGWGATAEGMKVTIKNRQLKKYHKSGVINYGISPGGQISCALRQVTVPVVSNAECNIYYSNSIKSSQVCAGLKAGGKDSCQVGSSEKG